MIICSGIDSGPRGTPAAKVQAESLITYFQRHLSDGCLTSTTKSVNVEHYTIVRMSVRLQITFVFFNETSPQEERSSILWECAPPSCHLLILNCKPLFDSGSLSLATSFRRKRPTTAPITVIVSAFFFSCYTTVLGNCIASESFRVNAGSGRLRLAVH